jgi:ligand-binding sensor domain-containing protein
MKTTLPCLISLVLAASFISCNGQSSTSSNTQDTPQHKSVYETGKHPSAEQLQAQVDAGFDPYFIESRDTFSMYGPDCIVRDVLCDSKGNVWLASWHGIIKYDGKAFTNYTLKENLIHFHMLSCFEDSKGNLWFGSARGGVYRYDGKTFQLFTKKNGLADNTVSSFAEDKQGKIWFATDSGASSFDGQKFAKYSKKDGVTCGPIHSVMCDKNGTVWFGGNFGITKYDGNAFTEFKDGNGKPFSLVESIYQDTNGTVWIGKMYGLTLYDGKTFTDPISNNLTYYITGDHSGNVWYTHCEPNLYYELPRQILFRSDGKSFNNVVEKATPNDFQLFGKSADKAGNIWFGTMHGVYMFDGTTTVSFRW